MFVAQLRLDHACLVEIWNRSLQAGRHATHP
jgi:hypothetical protein